MKFVIDTHKAGYVGRLSYTLEEYSFDFCLEASTHGVTSLIVNDLQLEIDEEQHVLCAWGLCPHPTWGVMSGGPPPFFRGGLEVLLDGKVIPGVSHRLTAPATWPAYVNWETGWVCLGDATADGSVQAVEFATNTVAVLKDEALVALWLRADNLGDLRKAAHASSK